MKDKVVAVALLLLLCVAMGACFSVSGFLVYATTSELFSFETATEIRALADADRYKMFALIAVWYALILTPFELVAYDYRGIKQSVRWCLEDLRS